VNDERPIRTLDLRLWTLSEIGPDARDPLLAAFLEDVRTLIAERYAQHLDARWICERKTRAGGPRVRVQPDDDDGRDEGKEALPF
jgi:hypothetical protein